MSLTYIGPIALSYHYEPAFAWIGESRSNIGTRPVSIDGMLHWDDAKALQELVNAADRRVAIGGSLGVLEPVWQSDDLLRDFNGWYLLQSVEIAASQTHSLHDFVPCTVSGLHLGDPQIVVTRSTRAKTTGLALTKRSTIVQPLWGDDPEATGFIVNPGGTGFTREYDPRTEYIAGQPTANSRNLRVRYGSLPADPIASIAIPKLAHFGNPPGWVQHRGGDVRAYDRRSGRHVYGPSHPFREPTDIQIENGLIRIWIGSRGLPLYASAQAFRNGGWHQIGVLALSDPTMTDQVLRRARLVTVTRERAVVHLEADTGGEIWLTVKRGERAIRVRHGSTFGVTTSVQRQVRWLGLPPHKALSPTLDAEEATFNRGIRVGGRAEPWWPKAAPVDDLTVCFHWKPDMPADKINPGPLTWGDDDWGFGIWGGQLPAQVSSGLLSLLDASDERLRITYVEDPDRRIHAEIDGDGPATEVLDFQGGDDVFLCVRLSGAGLVLSVSINGGAVTHIARPDITEPGHTDVNWTTLRLGEADSLKSEGVVDDYRVFARALTDSEVESLAAAVHGTDGLPDPEADLVWHAPLDAAAIPSPTALTTGRIQDDTFDTHGLRRAVVVLDGGFSASGVGVMRTATTFEALAAVVTADAGDTASDYQQQFAAEAEQELRAR